MKTQGSLDRHNRPGRSCRPGQRIRREILCLAAAAIFVLLPANAFATLITSAGDASLSGALLQDFDSTVANSFFATQTFLIGTDGFSVTPINRELHIDNQYCGSFGTAGNCLDTMNNSNQANDDFDVVFTGAGVSAFGFDLVDLDNDWTVETYDSADNLLGTYLIASQSPGLTGFNRRGYFGAAESTAIQYFTVRSTGNDRALIDNFSYATVPEPNVGMLLGLGMLTLAGSRFRQQTPTPSHARHRSGMPDVRRASDVDD